MSKIKTPTRVFFKFNCGSQGTVRTYNIQLQRLATLPVGLLAIMAEALGYDPNADRHILISNQI